VTEWPVLLVPLVVVGPSALWVYVDAQRLSAAGSPVFARIGNLTVDEPRQWFAGCLLLWAVFVPMNLLSRART
jgi:hypothetical protein